MTHETSAAAISVEDTLASLDSARRAYEEAEKAEAEARRFATAARNRLMEAQKAFDTAVNAIQARHVK